MFYNSESALFWYKAVFMAELLFAEFMFTVRLNKKNRFALRLFLSCAICILVAFALPIFGYNAFYSSLLFFTLFFVSILVLKLLCFKESWLNVLFCCIAAYAVQHIAFETCNLIIVSTGLNKGLPLEVYGDKMQETYDALQAFIYIESYLIVYWLCFLAFGRRLKKNEDMRIMSVSLFLIAAATIFVAVVLNAVVIYYDYRYPDSFFLSIVSLLIIIVCIFALCLQFGQLYRKNLKQDLDTVKTMWVQEEKQYSALKENIDYINIKCHDLKHQIHAIGENLAMDESSIREIQDVINVYDSSVKTGNGALDVVLMEKGLLCTKNEMRLTSVADGKSLSFMRETDIYSLFGNAIDNAVEALSLVPEKEKRVISLYVKNVGNFVSVHIYNYCPVELRFQQGLPVTTHRDTLVHGYGMKSMKLIAEKYEGDFSVALKDNIFHLNILFPVPMKGYDEK